MPCSPSVKDPDVQVHPNTIYRHWYVAREAAGRPDLRIHDLRHTGAVLAAQTGATLAELMVRRRLPCDISTRPQAGTSRSRWRSPSWLQPTWRSRSRAAPSCREAARSFRARGWGGRSATGSLHQR